MLPPQESLLRRLPPEPALIGLRLFKGDLERLVAEHFVEEGRAAAVQAMREGLVSREELAAVIARATAIQRLELDAADLTVGSGINEEGEPWAHTTLSYTGATMLFRGKAPGSTMPSNLRATYNENTLSFGIIVQQAEWRRAEQVIRSGVRLVEYQLQAQAEVLARYEGNMAHNAGALAAALLERRKGGSGADRITVNVQR